MRNGWRSSVCLAWEEKITGNHDSFLSIEGYNIEDEVGRVVSELFQKRRNNGFKSQGSRFQMNIRKNKTVRDFLIMEQTALESIIFFFA